MRDEDNEYGNEDGGRGWWWWWCSNAVPIPESVEPHCSAHTHDHTSAVVPMISWQTEQYGLWKSMEHVWCILIYLLQASPRDSPRPNEDSTFGAPTTVFGTVLQLQRGWHLEIVVLGRKGGLRLAVAKPHHKIWCCWWVPLPAFLGKAVRNLLTMIFHSWLPCGMLTLCSVFCDIPLKIGSFEEFHDGAQNHKNSSTGAPHSKVQTISQNLWPNPKNTPGFAGNYIYMYVIICLISKLLSTSKCKTFQVDGA